MADLKVKCYKAALDYANAADKVDKANYALSLANSIICTRKYNFVGDPKHNCLEMLNNGYDVNVCSRCMRVFNVLEKRTHFKRSLGSTKGWIRKLGKQIQETENG